MKKECDEIILALDVASKKTGYAIFIGKTIVYHGTWRLKSPCYHLDLFNRITQTIQKHKVTHIVSEDIFMDSSYVRVNVYPILAECKGVVKLAVQQSGITISHCTPIRIKQHIWGMSGKRKLGRDEEKQMMIQAITNNYGYALEKPNADDEADAIGLLITYLDNKDYKVEHPNKWRN